MIVLDIIFAYQNLKTILLYSERLVCRFFFSFFVLFGQLGFDIISSFELQTDVYDVIQRLS